MGTGDPNKLLLPNTGGGSRGHRRGWSTGKTLRRMGGWRELVGESLSEGPKILPLDDSVRTTAEGVKVAPWGGPDGGLKMERMSFVLSVLGLR